jgi:dihydroorotase
MRPSLTITRPDDWHLHLRDGALLEAVAPESAQHFARALIMPNLVPPVVTAAQASAYRARILEALPMGSRFEPLMTLYLTETTQADDVARAFASGAARAVKLYPAGATTNSESGVRNLERVSGVLERMAEIGMPLCIHGEVTSAEVDIFDREKVFIETVLEPLRRRFAQLRIVLEHVTTADGIDYVENAGVNLAATLTVHHLIINRNAILAGGIRPHYYCLPIAKRERHREALCTAATGGSAKFFLGTDSAPHLAGDKEAACGCAGIFSATNALACLAQIFETSEALERLEAFVSLNGANFYRQQRNGGTITLVRHDAPVVFPDRIETAGGHVVVFDPQIPVHWEVMAR